MTGAVVKPPAPKTAFLHKDLTGIDRLTAAEITTLLDLAETYIDGKPQPLLKGMVLLNLFLENSTRTRVSFEMATKRLGGEAINMSAEGSSVKKGESLTDTLKTLAAMKPDIFVIRHREEGAAQTAAEIMSCPVINAGDGTREHPTQALLDALTLRRHFGRLQGLNVSICGDILHSRVARSNGILLEKMGAAVTWVGPKELLPQNLASSTSSLAEGLKNADAVMTLRIQKERLQQALSFSEAQYFESYGLTEEKMTGAKKGAMVLHPGPVNRGVEIDPRLADNPKRSLILTQVAMGVAVRMACLDLLTQSKR